MIKTLSLFIALLSSLYLFITFLNTLFSIISAFKKNNKYVDNSLMIIGLITIFLWTLFYYLNL